VPLSNTLTRRVLSFNSFLGFSLFYSFQTLWILRRIWPFNSFLGFSLFYRPEPGLRYIIKHRKAIRSFQFLFRIFFILLHTSIPISNRWWN